MNFYEVFMRELNKASNNITDAQMESMRDDTSFLDVLDEDALVEVANTLILFLTHYNNSLDEEALNVYYRPKTKEEKSVLDQHISTTKKFIKMLSDETLVIPVSIAENISHEEYITDLTKRAEKVLYSLQGDNLVFRKKGKSSKTHIRNYIYEICDRYELDKSRAVKKFIDNLDEYSY